MYNFLRQKKSMNYPQYPLCSPLTASEESIVILFPSPCVSVVIWGIGTARTWQGSWPMCFTRGHLPRCRRSPLGLELEAGSPGVQAGALPTTPCSCARLDSESLPMCGWFPTSEVTGSVWERLFLKIKAQPLNPEEGGWQGRSPRGWGALPLRKGREEGLRLRKDFN